MNQLTFLTRSLSAIRQARRDARDFHRKRNPAPFPASLSFRFGFALPHRLNFARNRKNGRKQSRTSVSRSIPSRSPTSFQPLAPVETRIALPTEGDSLLVRHFQAVNRINSRICWSLVCDVAHELAMPAKICHRKKVQRDGSLSAPCAGSTGGACQ
jgi:hypothetical protein